MVLKPKYTNVKEHIKYTLIEKENILPESFLAPKENTN
jgi:hypothetical protein